MSIFIKLKFKLIHKINLKKMSNINLKNNVIYYFLISNLKPMIKIFELINTNDQDTYIEAQEILGNYSRRKHPFLERIKIESRDNSFHIYITKEEFIFISYSNQSFFSSEQNFSLFDEIYEYLISNTSERSIREQSFLIEDEKEEIKDIINKHIEEAFIAKKEDILSASEQTENERDILQVVNSNDDINNKNFMSDERNNENMDLNKNNIIDSKIYINENKDEKKVDSKNLLIKNILKNFSESSPNEMKDKNLEDKNAKKNESSGEEILNNQNFNNSSLPTKAKTKSYTNMPPLKPEIINSKNKISSRTLISNYSKFSKNFNNMKEVKEKPNEKLKNKNSLNKNYSYNKVNYNNINFKKNKPDSCSKSVIIGILISVIILQIAAIPLVINFYDFSV
jgi:hypothetical protein